MSWLDTIQNNIEVLRAIEMTPGVDNYEVSDTGIIVHITDNGVRPLTEELLMQTGSTWKIELASKKSS